MKSKMIFIFAAAMAFHSSAYSVGLICFQTQSQFSGPILSSLESFADGAVPDLSDPQQAALFHLYRLMYMGDPTTQLHNETTGQIARILQEHPELKNKIRFRSVKVTSQAPLEASERIIKTVESVKNGAQMKLGKLLNIEANGGFWNKVFENLPVLSEKTGILGSVSGMMHALAAGFGKAASVVGIEQNIGARWKQFLPDELVQKVSLKSTAASSAEGSLRDSSQKALALFQRLQKIRMLGVEKFGEGHTAMQPISQAMADLILMAPFGDKAVLELLKNQDGNVVVQVFDSLLAEANTLAQTAGYTDYPALLKSLNIKQPQSLPLPYDKFMASWNEMRQDAANRRVQAASLTNQITIRQLSATESVFRSCLGGNECSSRTYPEKALDPNYQYFTMTDSEFHSDSHVTVVLGTGTVNGVEKKIAFIDKMQNVPANRMALFLEGVRQSLLEKGYELAAPAATGDDHTGMSNDASMRKFFARTLVNSPELAVEGYAPHPQPYGFQVRFSRAQTEGLTLYLLKPLETEGATLHLTETANWRPAGPISLEALARSSYGLKNGGPQSQVVYIKTQEVLKELGLQDPEYSEISKNWLKSPEISFAVKKQVILSADPNQIIPLAEQNLNESEQKRFFSSVFPSNFYRAKIGKERVYAYLQEHPEYLAQISSDNFGGFSLGSALRVGAPEVFAAALASPAAQINKPSKTTGDTPAHSAAKYGTPEQIQALKDRGAEIEEPNFKNNTPLIKAIRNGKTENAMSLLSHDLQKLDHETSYGDFGGRTALFYAIKEDQPQVAAKLLEKGASPTFGNMYGDVVSNGLFVAIHYEKPEVLQALVNSGRFDINQKDEKGFTPLMKASKKGRRDLVDILLAAGADKQAVSENGNTAAKFARKAGFEELANLLTP